MDSDVDLLTGKNGCLTFPLETRISIQPFAVGKYFVNASAAWQLIIMIRMIFNRVTEGQYQGSTRRQVQIRVFCGNSSLVPWTSLRRTARIPEVCYGNYGYSEGNSGAHSRRDYEELCVPRVGSG